MAESALQLVSEIDTHLRRQTHPNKDSIVKSLRQAGSALSQLLQSSTNETKYDLVVAKDGTGNFTTISEAVDVAPNSCATRFVIYIKAGAYFENVEVVKKKTNLMFLGDGIGNTIVKASWNVVDGWTTF
ncbi:probable pectinesterase/pectinesterase inhibitor 40 [Malus domestica]|uniref:probable pectinesterase/pectinesterase inhibitor 40 n=1 Tax=Malus domestica TaxID=3750 RepID=UPI0039762D81